MHIVGIDLSGPVNTADTVLVAFEVGSHQLHLADCQVGADDQAIFELVRALVDRNEVVLGLDAPLSYNPGGGDRPADRQLRKKATAAGLPPGTVMTPTMTRMVYLTLRGIHLAHTIRRMNPSVIEIVETHPGAVLAFHGADSEIVRELKRSRGAQIELLTWLKRQGLQGVDRIATVNDHVVAACACALGAWKWQKGEAVWSYPASWPFDHFPVAC